MRIGFLQFRPEYHSVERNLDLIREAVRPGGADLLVLPELCTTGYLFRSRSELARFAEPVPGGASCQALAEASRRTGTTLVWGMAELSGDKVHNSAVMVTPTGNFHTYRKAHLFMDEKDIFDPGDSPFPVFDLGGIRVGMLVCFDHFFPEAARSLALQGAQVICHPSNLVLEHAQRNTITRAVENRVFWILANRTGEETLDSRTLAFNGQSQIVSPTGDVLARAGREGEELQVFEIDPAIALDKKVTPRNDLFQDRRTDLYRI